MDRCASCGSPSSFGELYCSKCANNSAPVSGGWNDSSKPLVDPFPGEPLQIQAPSSSRAFGASTLGRKALIGVGAAAFAGLAFVAVVAGGIASLFAGGSSDQASGAGVPVGSAEVQQSLDSVYFGPGIVPLFTGRTAESAEIIMRDQFDERFDEVKNLDTESKMTTFYDDARDLRELEGLFVCSQSVAPGADVSEFAFGYLDIEVSASCANSEIPFAMGPAAELLGRYVPAGFNNECYRIDSCDLNEIDGVIIEFLDEEYLGHKRALVLTGLGETEVELAMVDIAQEWCDANAEEGDPIWVAAIAERDRLLPTGSIIRMRGADDLYGDRRFVHRVSTDGQLTDGEPPVNSVNELLVATGYWVPDDDAGEHPWKNVSYFQKEMNEPTWVAEEPYSDTDQTITYRERIIAAANGSFAAPNPLLATCLQEKEDSVVILIAEEKREEEENRRLEQERLDRQAELDESGGGANCTWVNGYYRGNSFVRGHWRCR